jgi:uncharacterized membrane protein
MELNLSLLGWPHTLACLVAMAAFFPVILTRKGGLTHRTWGQVYTLSYVAACITSLGIYQLNKFWFPHWLAIGGLVVVGVGYLAVRFKPRGWQYVHILGMLLSASNLFGGAINEAYLRVKFLKPMLGTPIHGLTQAVVGQIFIILIVAYVVITGVRSRRPKRTAVEESLS